MMMMMMMMMMISETAILTASRVRYLIYMYISKYNPLHAMNEYSDTRWRCVQLHALGALPLGNSRDFFEEGVVGFVARMSAIEKTQIYRPRL